MDALTPSGAVLLALVLVLLPALAVRTARRMRSDEARASSGGAEPPSAASVWVSSSLVQAAVFAAAWLAARDYGLEPFALPALGLRELSAAALALVVLLSLVPLSRSIRTESERERMRVLAWLPDSPREWTLYGLLAAAAGVSEELAYRGVAVEILGAVTGSTALSISLSATAFAVAHAVQGWKSGVLVLVMALTCQALVAATSTLVLAMVVHAGYDVLAAALASRDRRRTGRSTSDAQEAS